MEDEMMDEISKTNKHISEGGIGGGDENNPIRVTKNMANELNHAKCILKLTFTKFFWTEDQLRNFHRPNI